MQKGPHVELGRLSEIRNPFAMEIVDKSMQVVAVSFQRLIGKPLFDNEVMEE